MLRDLDQRAAFRREAFCDPVEGLSTDRVCTFTNKLWFFYTRLTEFSRSIIWVGDYSSESRHVPKDHDDAAVHSKPRPIILLPRLQQLASIPILHFGTGQLANGPVSTFRNIEG